MGLSTGTSTTIGFAVPVLLPGLIAEALSIATRALLHESIEMLAAERKLDHMPEPISQLESVFSDTRPTPGNLHAGLRRS